MNKEIYFKILSKYLTDPPKSQWHLKPHRYAQMGGRARSLYNRFGAIYKEGGKVLDVTSSIGYYGAYFQAVKGFKFEYSCLDISEEAKDLCLRLFRELGLKEPKFTVGDILDRWPYLPESFDVVILMDWFGREWPQKGISFEHVFGEVKRILKPSGILIGNFAFRGSYVPVLKWEDVESLERDYEVIHLDPPRLVRFMVLRKRGKDE